MHYLLIAINNSSNANWKSGKNNRFLCLALQIKTCVQMNSKYHLLIFFLQISLKC